MTHIKKGLPEYPPSAHTKNSRLVRSGIIAFTCFHPFFPPSRSGKHRSGD